MAEQLRSSVPSFAEKNSACAAQSYATMAVCLCMPVACGFFGAETGLITAMISFKVAADLARKHIFQPPEFQFVQEVEAPQTLIIPPECPDPTIASPLPERYLPTRYIALRLARRQAH